MTNSLTEVADPERAGLEDLFAQTQLLPAVVGAALEGRLGSVWATAAGQTRSARLDIGCFSIFGGAPSGATLEGLRETRDLIAHEPGWDAFLRKRFGPRLAEKPMEVFDPRSLDRDSLRQQASDLAEGYQLVPFDAPLAAQLGPALEPHALQAYPDAAAFLEQGQGVGAVWEGQLACSVTSYVAYSGGVEVAVSTHAEHRGKGLARATSAAFLLRCLEGGGLPYWCSSNPASQRLARRLGYSLWDLCPQLVLSAP